MVAVVLGDSPIRLWGLTPAERIERQLRAEGIRVWREGLAALPPTATCLALRGDFLYDARAIRGLVKTPQAMLEVDVGAQSLPVAAHVRAEQAEAVAQALIKGSSRPARARHRDARGDRARL